MPRRVIVPEPPPSSSIIVPKAIIPLSICKAFDNLNSGEIAQLSESSVMQNYLRGSVIAKQHEASDYYYVIIDGYVLSNSNDGLQRPDQSFTIHPAGFLFEKDTLFGIKKYVLSYKTLTNVQAIRIDKHRIDNLLTNTTFKDYIMDELNNEILSLRWRATNNTFTIELKVSKLVLMLSEKFGNPLFKISNTDMAQMLDSTRESVNRTLNKLWNKGLIEMESGNIFVNSELKNFIEIKPLKTA